MDRNSGLGRQQGRTDFGSKEDARTQRRGCVLRCPRAAGFVDTKSFPDASRAPYTFYDERSERSPAFLPSLGGIGTAESLARFYALLCSDQLFPSQKVDQIGRVRC